MLKLLAQRWMLMLCLVLFVICKLPDIGLAFYWDESWVYAPGVAAMYHHGASLSPISVPVAYSRGHPMLFHALCTLWLDVFGKSNASMHSFALFVSIALAIIVYEIVLKHFGQRAAITCLLLLLLNHQFFVASTQVLNDIMLGLFAFLSLYFYAREQYVLTTLFFTLTYYTKESGLVLALVIFADIIWSIFKRKEQPHQMLQKSLCLVIPLLLTAIFYIAQKQMTGWYFNPGHLSLINVSFANTIFFINNILHLIFEGDSNIFFWGYAVVLSLIAAWQQKKVKYLLFSLFIVAAYLMVFVFSYKDAVYAVFICSIPATWVVILQRPITFFRQQGHFLKLAISFGIVYIYFCSVNFYESRYLFPALLIFSVMMLALVCDYYMAKITVNPSVALITLLFIAGLYSFTFNNCALIENNRVRAQQALIDYLEKNNYYDSHIYCRPYLERMHLLDPNTGFLRSSRIFTHVTDTMEDNTALIVFDNIEPGAPDSIKNSKGVSLVCRFAFRDEYAELYQKTN